MSAAFSQLDDVAEFINGAAFKPEDWGDEGARIIRIQNLNDPTKPYNRTTRQIPERLHVNPGDILVSWSASLGVFEWEGPDVGLLNQHIFRVLPNEQKVDKRYLLHALELALLDMQKHLHGATMMHVNRGEFLATKLYLPLLPEQRRIAAILDQADALRAKRREALAQLDSLTQSIFIEMFGDPVANPKGWSTKSISELLADAEVFVDGDWVESKDQDPDGEVRLIQLADIGDGYYIDKSARFLNKQTALRLKCTTLKVGDVLIARMPDPLGRACLFPGDAKECVTVVDVCIVRPSSEGPNPTWLMCCINSKNFRRQIAGEASGATRVRISRGNLSRLEVIAPPLSLQIEFAKKVAAVDDLCRKHCANANEMDGLFASLQHQAFRGEL